MKLFYDKEIKTYIWKGLYEERSLPRQAGFQWNSAKRYWFTKSSYSAYQFKECGDEKVKKQLNFISLNIVASHARGLGVLDSEIPAPKNLEYRNFQKAGITNLCRQYNSGAKALMLTDEQGLGKTIQAVGVANNLKLEKLLIICPASLRQNWKSEVEKWHLCSPGVEVLTSGKQKLNSKKSVITSYELIRNVFNLTFDFIIVDESHFLKSRTARRTKLILNKLIPYAKTLFLTGTPIPNNASEFFPILKACAPEILEGANFWHFVEKYHSVEKTVWGTKILGAKNTKGLNVRLRGSGFMTRRLKENVLQDLPPKSYKMVVFPAVGKEIKAILKAEKNFNITEIAEMGLLPGSEEATAYAETRRLMGLAKIPQCAEYIKTLLDYGVQKIVVFAHHISVVEEMTLQLGTYGVAAICGKTPMKLRQKLVDQFQNDENTRVFIGNSAAETGITLTAANDVIILEPDFVPGKNDQRVDRLHRIGQTKGVVVHQLVVEGSMDIDIYRVAARKRKGIEGILC